MGLFSFFRKNKQESASGQGEFLSRSAGEPSASRSSRSAGSARKSSKEDAVDPALPEKKRARRRLIGAVALVLAVVIVLPMILDSEPHPLAEDIAIQIPSKDGKDGKDTEVATDKSKAPAAEPKEEFVDPATMNAGVDKPAAIAPGAPAMPSGPANEARASSSPVPPTVEKPEKPLAPKEVAKPAGKSDAKAEAKTDVKENKTESKAESKTAAKSAERKDEHKKDAKEAAKEAAKPKTADKPDDAARALAILEGKSSAAAKKPAPSAGSGKFVIQVAALATQEKVDELRGKLSGAGIKSYTQKVATQSGDRTRIRVGPFASRDEADKMRAKINKLGLNATVVPA